MQKVNEILELVSWVQIISTNWIESLEVAFTALLNCVTLGKIEESKQLQERVAVFLDILNIDRISFDSGRDPQEIRMSFKYNAESGILTGKLLTMLENLLAVTS